MIRHRFGGNLRAARASVLRRRPSRTAAVPPTYRFPSESVWSASQHRAPDGASSPAAARRPGRPIPPGLRAGP